MIYYIIWTLVILASLWLYFRRIYSRFSRYGIKHLAVIPPFGQMTRVILRKENIVDNIVRAYNSFPNDVFIGTYQFLTPIVMIRDLNLIKKITVKDFDYFLDHRTIIDEHVEPFFALNLFALKGQKWKDMRSTLSPAFTSSKIRLMVPFMIEIGEQMINSIKKQIEASEKDYIDIESKDMLSRYANDVIASCAFGLKVNSHTDVDNQFYAMGKSISTFSFSQVLKFFACSAFPNVMKRLKISIFAEENKAFFRNLVLDTMKDREERNINRNDMIHLLMEAKKGRLTYDNKLTKDDDAGFATVEESDLGKKQINRVWSDEELIVQAVLFFIAGFETVSSTMTFLLYELAVNTDVQETLYQEIKDAHEKNNGKLDYNSIQHMKYLDMVVSELLRKWSPGIVTDRLCIKDYNLGRPNKDATEDYIIRKGEVVYIPIWAIHRNPEYFPDPMKFDPERFSEENKHDIRPFTYLPFGLGPRNCIGSRFALCEVKVMVYQLLQVMELSPAEKTLIPAELIMQGFTLKMKGGHWIRLRPRN